MVVPVEAVDIAAGFHVPVMPLREVPGSGSGAAPTQYGPSWVNVGVILLVTCTLIVVWEPHWPASGVNVYMVVPVEAVEITAGFHVPVIPLLEVVGRLPAAAPTQYGPSWVKVGVIDDVTTISIVVNDPH